MFSDNLLINNFASHFRGAGGLTCLLMASGAPLLFCLKFSLKWLIRRHANCSFLSSVEHCLLCGDNVRSSVPCPLCGAMARSVLPCPLCGAKARSAFPCPLCGAKARSAVPCPLCGAKARPAVPCPLCGVTARS